MKGDPASVDDFGHPLLEVLEHEVVLVRAVDEEQLDRFVEGVRGQLRKRRDRRDELGDSCAVDIRLEVPEAMVGMRVDCIDGNRCSRQ